jgi:hypothetical protein
VADDTLCLAAGALVECLRYFCAPGDPAGDARGCLKHYQPGACPATEPFCDETGLCSARRCVDGCDDRNPCDGTYRCNTATMLCELVSDAGCPDPDETGCLLPFCDLTGTMPVCGRYAPPGCSM